MDIRTTLVTDAKPAVLVQPTQSAFDNPTVHTETAAVFAVALGQNGLDVAIAKCSPMRLRVIGSVTLDALRTATWSPRFASYRRYGINQRKQLGHVMPIGCRKSRCQRNALGIGEHMVFRALFAAIRRIGPRVRPPKIARTDAESTIARDQSILSAPRRCASKIRWSSSQTPARCQSRSRRQHVIPLPQPISCGRYSQGMPVMRTNKMPVKASRLPMGFRPGYRNLRGLTLGKIGSTSDHRVSSNTGLAMCVPPCTTMTFIGPRNSFC